ncbi:class I SAM-dependent methyltransferase [Chthonobacter albigriseus]|uniref:class I SAM-dependent methyltransferase n=1 Tax=Chthonobacter albigriseus TaxID=1683161 RepID=UPI0015EE5337|nr:class I SAM-dependent methyltransferase [Chthonobacter albigriseus]
MSGFSATWLDLREAADGRARDTRLLTAAAALVDAADAPLVVDLGTGTGAMARALAQHLQKAPEWLLVDADLAVLAEADARAGSLPGQVSVLRHDLSTPTPLPVSGATLVTASALFDLVSDTFAERLVATLAAGRTALHANLIYDGTTEWHPAHPLDEPVLAAFNRHQRRDKGFGAALGPSAPGALAEKLNRAGFHVSSALSAWRLGPEDEALVRELATGIASAAHEEGHLAKEAVDEWLDFRLQHAGEGRCIVGHVDILATV